MTQDNSSEPRDTIPCLAPYEDAELDTAMRELEALERGEQACPAFTRCSLALAFWKAFGVGAAMAGLLLSSSPAAADDAPAKVKRPVLCMQGQPVSGKGFAGYLCLDGKRPRVFTRYIEVRFVDSEGRPASYVLGWVAPVKRTSKGGIVAEGTPTKPASTLKL